MRPDRELSWVADGQARCEQTVMELADLGGPSRLPGWTRGHVITHLARNAEGLCRLLTWARTGIETPMYPSSQARDADIEAGARRPKSEQLDDLRRTGAAFTVAAGELYPQHWKITVRTRHGPLLASSVPWARVRELWLHLVDLDVGVGLGVLPADIATALVREVVTWMSPRVSTRIELHICDQAPATFGPESSAAVVVGGPVQELAGWLTGRSPGDVLTAPDGLPELPRWI